MDDIVRKALAKWPNVPHAYGWLSLDARGHWRLKQERITNAALSSFIARNYQPDEEGRWFFQNGPQRVYVTLECTPFVFRLAAAGHGELTAHTGEPAGALHRIWLDEGGRMIALTRLGVGVIDDRDLPDLCERLRAAGGDMPDETTLARWLDGDPAVALSLADEPDALPVVRTRLDDLACAMGFVRTPRPRPGEPEC
jgi:hypothetical protein